MAKKHRPPRHKPAPRGDKAECERKRGETTPEQNEWLAAVIAKRAQRNVTFLSALDYLDLAHALGYRRWSECVCHLPDTQTRTPSH